MPLLFGEDRTEAVDALLGETVTVLTLVLTGKVCAARVDPIGFGKLIKPLNGGYYVKGAIPLAFTEQEIMAVDGGTITIDHCLKRKHIGIKALAERMIDV